MVTDLRHRLSKRNDLFQPLRWSAAAGERFYWRERLGRLRALPPEEAAFRAYEDFADDYYSRNRHRSDAETDFEDIAAALEHVAPYTDRDGRYRERETFLSERWATYLKGARAQRVIERAKRNANFEEVLSHQFTQEEIEAAWQGLLTGSVPLSAKSVFLGAHPRSSAHEIAAKMIIPLRDVVFWAVVFRNHGMMEEHVISDRHLYTSTYAHRDPASLREPLSTLVSRLSG